MKIAIVHDWLNGMRGGEKVLELLCDIFPDAPIHTLFCDRSKLSPYLRSRTIVPTVMQKFPLVKKLYRHYLPFYTFAVGREDLSGYDVIVSISTCIAKGFRRRAGSLHICYCNTPMRYAWGFSEQYFGTGLKRRLIDPTLSRLREWDRRSSDNVDFYIANSHNIADRIKRYYDRDTDAVIYPPVDTGFFTPGGAPGDFYLFVSALTPYKRADLAAEACRLAGVKLVVVGSGPEEKRLRRLAGPSAEFIGWQSGDELRRYYRTCRAFIFPAEEDFGIVPLEAQACGRPVIAFGKGGALETVAPHRAGYLPEGIRAGERPTGIFFAEQTAASLADAIAKFNKVADDFDPAAIRENALRFSKENCKEQLRRFIEGKIAARG
ncbi:MAG TPA: glycosyltransferase [bacterium]|nr:glycosyltransferase [bacterium]